jgi:hypothetical protein
LDQRKWYLYPPDKCAGQLFGPIVYARRRNAPLVKEWQVIHLLKTYNDEHSILLFSLLIGLPFAMRAERVDMRAAGAKANGTTLNTG